MMGTLERLEALLGALPRLLREIAPNTFMNCNIAKRRLFSIYRKID